MGRGVNVRANRFDRDSIYVVYYLLLVVLLLTVTIVAWCHDEWVIRMPYPLGSAKIVPPHQKVIRLRQESVLTPNLSILR